MPQKSKERPPRPRIEGLADLVFGLSLSLGALSLVVSPPSSNSEINSEPRALSQNLDPPSSLVVGDFFSGGVVVLVVRTHN
jgi:hypothetical protein